MLFKIYVKSQKNTRGCIIYCITFYIMILSIKIVLSKNFEAEQLETITTVHGALDNLGLGVESLGKPIAVRLVHNSFFTALMSLLSKLVYFINSAIASGSTFFSQLSSNHMCHGESYRRTYHSKNLYIAKKILILKF